MLFLRLSLLVIIRLLYNKKKLSASYPDRADGGTGPLSPVAQPLQKNMRLRRLMRRNDGTASPFPPPLPVHQLPEAYSGKKADCGDATERQPAFFPCLRGRKHLARYSSGPGRIRRMPPRVITGRIRRGRPRTPVTHRKIIGMGNLHANLLTVSDRKKRTRCLRPAPGDRTASPGSGRRSTRYGRGGMAGMAGFGAKA